ncbi:MAG: hypothetical protein U0457_05405 [Candidatus Sericytochromatia bacterium]
MIKAIEVNVTGEPTVQTIEPTKFSTNTLADGYVTTTINEKGYVNGIEQTGSGAGLKFEPKIQGAIVETDLDYMTNIDGQADINVFFDKKDNIVNDATMNVTVTYVEDEDGDGNNRCDRSNSFKDKNNGNARYKEQ